MRGTLGGQEMRGIQRMGLRGWRGRDEDADAKLTQSMFHKADCVVANISRVDS